MGRGRLGQKWPHTCSTLLALVVGGHRRAWSWLDSQGHSEGANHPGGSQLATFLVMMDSSLKGDLKGATPGLPLLIGLVNTLSFALHGLGSHWKVLSEDYLF